MKRANNLVTKIQQWVFPPMCCLCQGTSETSRDLCQYCEITLPWISDRCFRCAGLLKETDHFNCEACQTNPPSFDRLCSVFSYDPPVIQLIRGLKFGNRLVYGRVLGEMLADAVCHQWYQASPLPEVIIPVPLHDKRLRSRGFNQAVELLWPLKKRCAVPIVLDHCQRVRKTTAQSGLNKESRQRNIKNAFEVMKPIPYEHVAIVDDVVTTGSTVAALSRALKAAGVEQVDVWCLCRA